MHIEQYLNAVCQQIKYKPIHSSVREELETHITELQETYLSQGDTEEIATKKALEQMGNPQEIGKKLHQAHKPQVDWTILSLVGALVCFSIFVLSKYQTYLPNYNITERQSVFLLLALAIASIFYFTNYQKIYQYSFCLYGAATLLVILSFAKSVNAHRWLSLGAFSIDATTILLFLYILSISGLTIFWQTSHWQDSIKLLACTFLAIILVATISIAKAIILSFVSLGLLHYYILHAPWCKNSRRWLFILQFVFICFLLLAIFLAIGTQPYLQERLYSFFHPYADPMGSGYLTTQIQQIIANAQWFQSIPTEKITFQTQLGERFIVPEAHTDCIFSYILAEFGWGVALILCLGMAALICKMFLLTQTIKDRYGKALCYSITLFFAIQIILNILMNLTLFPLTSISLPFISYGGSMLLLDMIFMAIFLNVYRRKNLTTISNSAPGRLLPHITITWK